MAGISRYKAIILQIEEREIGFMKNLFKQIVNGHNIMNFNSRMIDEYFMEVSLYHTKMNLRHMMKLVIFAWFINMSIHTHYYSTTLSLMIWFIIVLGLIMLGYVVISYARTTNKLIQIAFGILILFYTSSISTSFNRFSNFETNFTPDIQISLLMFSNLPIKLNTALALSLVSYGFIVVSCSLFRNPNHNETLYLRNIQNLPFIEGIAFNPLSDEISSLDTFFLALCILGIALTLLTLYLYFVNNLRRRAAFVRLGQNMQAKRQLRTAMKSQLKWIETIMPSIVKEEYWEHNEEIKLEKWIYIKTFDNVSILFADIVGFTNMSSNKTAMQVVTMLNDLFNRFDEMCNLTSCEKLGTLGDCYYCVSGCPIPRLDHAMSCIEMGLGMCRIIRQFNDDHSESVNMRVGVHTGRVNAAIIGKQRFRFDVYSNDVIIANAMESSGKPGRVHISQNVYNFVKSSYNVEAGADMEIKREEDHGIAGMLLKSSFIKTYFVDPASSHIQRSQKDQELPTSTFRVFNTAAEKKDSENDQSDDGAFDNDDDDNENDDDSDKMRREKFSGAAASKRMFLDKLERDAYFIDGLRFDPDKQVKLFSHTPVNVFTLQFTGREIEWHYSNHPMDDVEEVTLDSNKLAPFLDCLTCFLYSSIIYITMFLLFPTTNMLILIVALSSIASFLIMAIISCHCYVSQTELKTHLDHVIYYILSNHITKCILCFYFVSTPFVIMILCLFDCSLFLVNYNYTVNFFTLLFFSLIQTPLYFSAHYFMKISIVVFNFSIAIIIISIKPCMPVSFNISYPYLSCIGLQKITNDDYFDRLHAYFVYQLVILAILVFLIIREVELNMRLWFYVSREAEIGREQAAKAARDSQELLYNIIPKHVFMHLKTKTGTELDLSNFSYASTVPKAAVVFACISNFFSKYYREDYKGGENALKLLHKIICLFDNLIKKERYKDVEKIKTINDCYMVASGLNVLETNKNISETDHLDALMHYCFDLIQTLKHFNENYIIGADKFEVKIGYNFGPVTAGIIGRTKPMYDIWGDTVNVASRMYSTGIPGQIQTPHFVCPDLKSTFYFKLRGQVFVKGKGNMDTYICLGSKEFMNSAKRKSVMEPFIVPTHISDTTGKSNKSRKTQMSISKSALLKQSTKSDERDSKMNLLTPQEKTKVRRKSKNIETKIMMLRNEKQKAKKTNKRVSEISLRKGFTYNNDGEL